MVMHCRPFIQILEGLVLYKASAPGSLMLLGEHAVLHHKKAMVLAIHRRIEVHLKPREDDTVIIRSALGELNASISTLAIQKPFDFVMASIKRFESRLDKGFELNIASEFSDQVGLGSSAAVSVAVLAVFYQWLGFGLLDASQSLEDFLFHEALQVVRSVQGFGSGADVAASVFGGVLLYQASSQYLLKRFSKALPITVVYSGAKTSTAIVVQQVNALHTRYPKMVDALYETIAEIVNEGALALEEQRLEDLGQLMNRQDACMVALGVSNASLENITRYLRQQPGIYGAKISGSGLGDCVIALGTCETLDINTMQGLPIPVVLSSEGVRYA